MSCCVGIVVSSSLACETFQFTRSVHTIKRSQFYLEMPAGNLPLDKLPKYDAAAASRGRHLGGAGQGQDRQLREVVMVSS